MKLFAAFEPRCNDRRAKSVELEPHASNICRAGHAAIEAVIRQQSGRRQIAAQNADDCGTSVANDSSVRVHDQYAIVQ